MAMKEVENILLELDPKNPEFQNQITKLYLLLDEACDAGKLNVKEMNALLDRVIMLRAKKQLNNI